MKHVLIIITAILLSACANTNNFSVRKDLPGTWGWANDEAPCGDSAQTYAFSGDGSKVILTTQQPILLGETKEAVYEVIDELPNVMRMRVIGETRKTDNGKLVVWDLVLKDKRTFCWHRTDWPATGCTAILNKCPST